MEINVYKKVTSQMHQQFECQLLSLHMRDRTLEYKGYEETLFVNPSAGQRLQFLFVINHIISVVDHD